MERARSSKWAAQPSSNAAIPLRPTGAPNTASAASAETSAKRANGPEQGLNAESMDVEQLISAFHYYTELAAKATKDRSAQLSLRNDADPFKYHLDTRLDDAITAAERGDGEAVKTLVTIAAADGMVGALAAKARKAIDEITHSSAAKTGAASNSADTIRTAISSLQEAYGAHMGDGTKEWVDSALRMPLSDRQAQIPTAQGRASVGASAASQPAGEAVNRRPETPEISEVRRPTRNFFSDEQLLPAMLRLKGDRFKVLSRGGGTTFPSQGNVTDQVGGMVRSAFANQNKPAVTLYHQAEHWVAIIAMPPAADIQNAKPSLVIFDSNAKQPHGDGTPSQVVGPTIAAALKEAGYEVYTAFGSIQDGMAANGCGPLCVAAIDAAFASSSAAEPALTAEVIAMRLNQYIQDFSSADQNQRDLTIASAEAFIRNSSPQSDRLPRVQLVSAKGAASAPELASVAASKSSLLTPEELRRIKSELRAERKELAKLKSQVERGLQEASAYERGTWFKKKSDETATAYTNAAQALHPLIGKSQNRILALEAKQDALDAYLAKVRDFAKLKSQREAAVREQERLASKPEGSNYNIDASVRSGVLSTKITDLTERMEALKGEGATLAKEVDALYGTPSVNSS
ncbi:MAG: hypothetical protein QE494_18275 [Ramlibacter sp.]|uniref:hypothetical protein n=1 Tax=Ramlibacter sp. TaxID=1917967 RepID=UPI002634CB3C|nr:hypothetical protein [Ramlibacter sp.]MDH4378244.1 hypothetical protein [Ramlibacter sp.]